MFSLFKKSRDGFWDKDKLYDLDTGLMLAELILYKDNVYNFFVRRSSHNQGYSGAQYQSKNYAMKAAEKYYNIKTVCTIVPRLGSSMVE